MRRIERGAAPHCLSSLRKEAARIQRETGQSMVAADWDPGTCAESLRDALHRDQQGLCAYCMQRIRTYGFRPDSAPDGNGGMKIEHFVPRSTAADQMYEWANLLAVCGGWHKRPQQKGVLTCDSSRGNQDLHVDPAGGGAPNPDSVFQYKRDGVGGLEIYSDDPDAQADIEVLNLNAKHLKERRRQEEQVIVDQLKRCKSPGEVRRLLNKQLQSVTNRAGTLPPFAAVVERYVRKKLAQH